MLRAEEVRIALGQFLYTPLTAALIDQRLGLPSAVYEPGSGSPLRKIVDDSGENAGYATFVDAMLAEATSERLHLHYNQELVSIQTADGAPVLLTFSSGLTASAASVVLNVPQLPLLKILSHSETSLLGPTGAVPPALQAPVPNDGVKLYVHYNNAWWRNLLNLTSGEFGPSIFNSSNSPLRQLPDLSGRYHDGHTRCDGAATAADAHTHCRGFLEATYTYGQAARWFVNQELQTDPPYTTLNYSKPLGKYALDLIHATLLSYHREALEAVPGFNATALVAALRPEFALLSYWGPQSPGYGGAVHQTRDGPLVKVEELAPQAMAPFDGHRVYVANEAFGALRQHDGVLGGHHGWAECSLVMAENVLTAKFGLAPPEWMNASVYDEYVQYHGVAGHKQQRAWQHAQN